MGDEESLLRLAMINGRELAVSTCVCAECGNEWWVPAASEEFLPRFCCYCGIEFLERTELT